MFCCEGRSESNQSPFRAVLIFATRESKLNGSKSKFDKEVFNYENKF